MRGGQHLRGPPPLHHPRVGHHRLQRGREQLGDVLSGDGPSPPSRIPDLPGRPVQRGLDGGQVRGGGGRVGSEVSSTVQKCPRRFRGRLRFSWVSVCREECGPTATEQTPSSRSCCCHPNMPPNLVSCVLWCGHVAAYVEQCGALTEYGMSHTRLMANMCNAGMGPADMTRAAHQACAGGIRPTTTAINVA